MTVTTFDRSLYPADAAKYTRSATSISNLGCNATLNTWLLVNRPIFSMLTNVRPSSSKLMPDKPLEIVVAVTFYEIAAQPMRVKHRKPTTMQQLWPMWTLSSIIHFDQFQFRPGIHTTSGLQATCMWPTVTSLWHSLSSMFLDKLAHHEHKSCNQKCMCIKPELKLLAR